MDFDLTSHPALLDLPKDRRLGALSVQWIPQKEPNLSILVFKLLGNIFLSDEG